jgi:hypothetical protein
VILWRLEVEAKDLRQGLGLFRCSFSCINTRDVIAESIDTLDLEVSITDWPKPALLASLIFEFLDDTLVC